MQQRKSPLGCWMAVSFMAASLLAHGVVRAAVDGRPAISEAYEKTKTATNAEDFTRIIELCEQARNNRLSTKMAEYAPKLLCWAHNRRGEVYTEEAAKAVAEGAADRATDLDARALVDFETAVELGPACWKALCNRGVSYALQGKYESAISDFSRVLELKPDYADARFNRGEVLYEIGRFEEALADYTFVVALWPRDSGALLNRGHTHFQLGQFQEALADYDEVIKLDVTRSAGYADRGEVYQRLGKWADAALDFQRAIKLDRKSVLAYRNAAWLMATCPEARFRDAELAVQAAEQALALDRQHRNWKTLDTLAAAHANAGRFEEAVKTGSQAIKAAPGQERSTLESRLELYRQNQPFRQVSVATASVPESGLTR